MPLRHLCNIPPWVVHNIKKRMHWLKHLHQVCHDQCYVCPHPSIRDSSHNKSSKSMTFFIKISLIYLFVLSIQSLDIGICKSPHSAPLEYSQLQTTLFIQYRWDHFKNLFPKILWSTSSGWTSYTYSDYFQFPLTLNVPSKRRNSNIRNI